VPIISSQLAPTFALGPDIVFTGLAAPSRGSRENSVWLVRLSSAEPAAEHSLDSEEVLVGVHGRAVASLDGTEHRVGAGDAIVVPAGTTFSLRCAEPADGESFAPPWAR